MLIDLHAHTSLESWDSTLTPDELVEGAKAAGLDGLCLTEHDQFWDLRRAGELAKRHHFTIIPGCEITTEQGHVLVFGIDSYVYGMHRAPFLREYVDRAGGVLLVVHPYRRAYTDENEPWSLPFDEQVRRAASGNAAFGLTEGVESLNGRGTPRQNEFSAALCAFTGLPSFGGSDTHDPDDMGVCATEFERPVSGLGDFIAEVKAGRFRAARLR